MYTLLHMIRQVHTRKTQFGGINRTDRAGWGEAKFSPANWPSCFVQERSLLQIVLTAPTRKVPWSPHSFQPILIPDFVRLKNPQWTQAFSLVIDIH